MKEGRTLLIVSLLALLGVIAAAGWHYWTHRIQEFSGTFVNRYGSPRIPEDPMTPAILLTTTGRYELEVELVPQWRDLLPRLDGKQVVVRGTLRIWQSRYGRQHRRIRVYELQLSAPGTTDAGANANG